MIRFDSFFADIATSRLSHWLETVPSQLAHWSQNQLDGKFASWQKVLRKFPELPYDDMDLQTQVRIGSHTTIDESNRKKVASLLDKFHPWRKGPYSLHGIDIDTEWRSDWKWDRLLPHISNLKHRYVLDVGCGNGYHMWRMRGEGAKMVVGIDPSQLFLLQFRAVHHFAGQPKGIHLLPLGIEQMPMLKAFDTVFSMGVLYHRKSPIDHLQQLYGLLHPGGELVLETIVIPGDKQDVLVPEDRYAQMRNVWYIPSSEALMLWLRRSGFVNVRLVNEEPTSVAEQRSTQWMRNNSLSDFLDPDDPHKTVEGYPAPRRAIIIANRPM